MSFRIFFIVIICIVSCAKPERPDIILDDFETGNFNKWNKQGTAFQLPKRVDSIKDKIDNYQGKLIAISDFHDSKLDWSQGLGQGKLMSNPFVINRKFIQLLIAGGKQNTRECVNLIINNKVVKFATGANDYKFRAVSWDVSEYEGQQAVLEIVDALGALKGANNYVLIDDIVFTDNTHKRELIFEDFESGTYNNWTVEGDAFVAPRNRTNVYYPISANGFGGDYFAFSFTDTHDKKQGKLISKTFTVSHDYIKFVIGGGNHKGKTCINLIVNDSIVFSNEGKSDDGQMLPYSWPLQAYKGEQARIEIVDSFSGNWGHIMVDDIIFYDAPPFYATTKFWLILSLIILFVLGILKLIKRNIGTPVVADEASEQLKTLKELIQKSEIYRKYNASINDVVSLSELSKETIEACFENSDKISFHHYLNILRVEDFKQQLKNSENNAFTMVSIAEKCGFSSKTSFYREFKSITNMTPSEYKKSIKG